MTHILLIEGDEAARTLLANNLRNLMYFTETAATSRALNALLVHDKNPYHAILVPCHLGLLHGPHLIAAIRKVRGFATTPLIGGATNPEIWKDLRDQHHFYRADKELIGTQWYWPPYLVLAQLQQLGL